MNKIDKSTAFKVVVNGVNKYYCSESEYTDINRLKIIKDKVFSQINEIFGYKVVNTILFKEVAEIEKIHTYSKINDYLYQNHLYLCSVMQKDFSSEYGRIRYFSAILKNSLTDFTYKEEPIKIIAVDIPKDNYRPKCKRKTLEEFEREVGD